MKITKLFNKIIALSVSICLLISITSADAFSAVKAENLQQQNNNNIPVISIDNGKITSINDTGSNLTVVNIQDLHCHKDTQKKISNMIEEINKENKVKQIYVEGGYGNININWLDKIDDKKIKEQIIEQLLQDGEITAGEYYASLKNNTVQLKGLDEKTLHQQNVERLSDIMNNQDKYASVIEKVRREIARLNKRYINAENRKFSKQINKYKTDGGDSGRLYVKLFKYIDEINNNFDKYNNLTKITKEKYPNIATYILLDKESKKIKPEEISRQIKTVLVDLKSSLSYGEYSDLIIKTNNLKDISKLTWYINKYATEKNINLSKYGTLSKFIEIRKINESLNPVKLLEEERDLIEQIRYAISYNKTEYEVAYISDFEEYFEKYLKYGLTSKDWHWTKKGFSKFRQLYAKYAVVDRIKEIEKDFVELDNYYNINDERNSIFVNNILNDKKITSNKKSGTRTVKEILKDSNEVIIVIAGGYHSDELSKMLSEKSVTNIVITPNVTGNIEKANNKYQQTIKEQAVIQAQALAFRLASCSDDVAQQKLLLKAGIETLGNDVNAINKLSSVLGIKINYDENKNEIEFDNETISLDGDITADEKIFYNKVTASINAAIKPFEETIETISSYEKLNEFYTNNINKLLFSVAVIVSDSDGLPSLETEQVLNENFEAFEKFLQSENWEIEQFFELSIQEQTKFINKHFGIESSPYAKLSIFEDDETAPFWEEIVFGGIVTVALAVFMVSNPFGWFTGIAPAILFIVSRLGFIGTHSVVEYFKYGKEKSEIRKNFIARLFPTTILSIPYALSLLSAGLGIGVFAPALVAATGIAMGLHWYWNNNEEKIKKFLSKIKLPYAKMSIGEERNYDLLKTLPLRDPFGGINNSFDISMFPNVMNKLYSILLVLKFVSLNNVNERYVLDSMLKNIENGEISKSFIETIIKNNENADILSDDDLKALCMGVLAILYPGEINEYFDKKDNTGDTDFGKFIIDAIRRINGDGGELPGAKFVEGLPGNAVANANFGFNHPKNREDSEDNPLKGSKTIIRLLANIAHETGHIELFSSNKITTENGEQFLPEFFSEVNSVNFILECMNLCENDSEKEMLKKYLPISDDFNLFSYEHSTARAFNQIFYDVFGNDISKWEGLKNIIFNKVTDNEGDTTPIQYIEDILKEMSNYKNEQGNKIFTDENIEKLKNEMMARSWQYSIYKMVEDNDELKKEINEKVKTGEIEINMKESNKSVNKKDKDGNRLWLYPGYEYLASDVPSPTLLNTMFNYYKIKKDDKAVEEIEKLAKDNKISLESKQQINTLQEKNSWEIKLKKFKDYFYKNMAMNVPDITDSEKIKEYKETVTRFEKECSNSFGDYYDKAVNSGVTDKELLDFALYIKIIMLSNDKNFDELEKIIADNDISIKHRLFALTYFYAIQNTFSMTTGSYVPTATTDRNINEDIISEIKEDFIDEIKSGEISINDNDNFILRAVATGIFLVIEDEFITNLSDKEKENFEYYENKIFEEISKAVFVNKKSRLLGTSGTNGLNIAFSKNSTDKICKVIAHELGHEVYHIFLPNEELYRNQFDNELGIEKNEFLSHTTDELFAEIITAMVCQVLNKEFETTDCLYKVYTDKAEKEYDEFIALDEYKVAKGLIHLLKLAFKNTGEDINYKIFAKSIIDVFQNIIQNENPNEKYQATLLREILDTYLDNIKEVYPEEVFSKIENIIREEDSWKSAVSDIFDILKNNDINQYAQIILAIVKDKNIKIPQSSYGAKTGLENLDLTEDDQVIIGMVLSQPENVKKVLKIIENIINKKEQKNQAENDILALISTIRLIDRNKDIFISKEQVYEKSGVSQKDNPSPSALLPENQRDVYEWMKENGFNLSFIEKLKKSVEMAWKEFSPSLYSNFSKLHFAKDADTAKRLQTVTKFGAVAGGIISGIVMFWLNPAATSAMFVRFAAWLFLGVGITSVITFLTNMIYHIRIIYNFMGQIEKYGESERDDLEKIIYKKDVESVERKNLSKMGFGQEEYSYDQKYTDEFKKELEEFVKRSDQEGFVGEIIISKKQNDIIGTIGYKDDFIKGLADKGIYVYVDFGTEKPNPNVTNILKESGRAGYVSNEEITEFPKSLTEQKGVAMLPENKSNLINWIEDNSGKLNFKTILKKSLQMARKEFSSSLSLNFVKRHYDVDKQTAGNLQKVTLAGSVIFGLLGLATVVLNPFVYVALPVIFLVAAFSAVTNLAYHTVIIYKYINSIKDIKDDFGSAVKIGDNNETYLSVYVTSDIGNYEGKKIPLGKVTEKGYRLYQIKKDGFIILGVDASKETVDETEKENIKSEIIKLVDDNDFGVKTKGFNIDRISVDDNITEDYIIEEGIIKINGNKLNELSSNDKVNFIKSVLKVKNANGTAMTDNMVFDLRTIRESDVYNQEDKNKFKLKLENAPGRVIISKTENDILPAAGLDYKTEDIENLKYKGTYVFVDFGKERPDKEQIKALKKSARSGYTYTDNGKLIMVDFSLGEEEIELKISKSNNIEELQNEIVLSKEPVVVDVSKFSEMFEEQTDKMRQFELFYKFINMAMWAKKTSTEALYNIPLDVLPNSIDNINLETDNTEIGILYRKLDNDDKEKFKEKLKNRIKVKNKIKQERDNVNLEQNRNNKNLEKMLARILDKKIETESINLEGIRSSIEHKTIVEIREEYDKMLVDNNINAILEKDVKNMTNEEKEIIAKLEILIPIIMDDKTPEISGKDNNEDIAKNYRAMLCAA